MDEAGSVAEIDERLAVCPALYDDAAWLRVERKQRAVHVTWRRHDPTKPPPHSTSVMHVHAEQLEVFVRIEVGRAADSLSTKSHNNYKKELLLSK